MQHGGKRRGAGRPSVLNFFEKLEVGNLCDAMQRERTKERSFVLALGEDPGQEYLAAVDALDEARKAFLSLPPDMRAAQRIAYGRRKKRLQAKLLETQENIKLPIDRRLLILSNGQGRPSKRAFSVDEKTRDEIIIEVAKIMSQKLGRPISAAAVSKAWKDQRKFNEPETADLENVLTEAARNLLKDK